MTKNSFVLFETFGDVCSMRCTFILPPLRSLFFWSPLEASYLLVQNVVSLIPSLILHWLDLISPMKLFFSFLIFDFMVSVKLGGDTWIVEVV